MYKDLFLGGNDTLNHPIPSNVNVSSLQEAAHYASQYAERWQDGLFLERYSATYQVLNNDRQVEGRVLYGQMVFRFTGWRNDLLKDVAEQLKVAHLLASVTIDVEQRQVVRFSHSQGTPFGYRAPLNLDRWPISEDDLFKICDAHGGQTFRLIHNVDLGHVGAYVRKPGREWSLVYNASPQSFRCLVNIDTARISVRDSTNEWQEVGTWMEELQTLEDSHKEQ